MTIGKLISSSTGTETVVEKYDTVVEVPVTKETSNNKKEDKNVVTKKLEDLLTNDVQIIGCYNSNTGKTSNVNQKGNCLKGNGGKRKNIMLPPKDHIDVRRKFYGDREIINRFPIVNYESSFTTHRGNVFAHGYVQTLKKRNISPEIRPQLQWMYNRERVILSKQTKGGSPRCGVYWEEDNKKDGFAKGEIGVLACMYRYHYHSSKGTWYAKRGIATRDYYYNWFANKGINL